MIVTKKKPFEIEIPVLEQSIYALAPSQDALIGRVIKLDLTRLLKGRNIDASLIIKKENEKLVADFIKINLLPTYIRKMIRKNISYVEDSFVVQGKDSKVIIKPYLITKKRVHRKIRNALRLKAREVITAIIKDRDNREIFFSILSGQMQKEVSVGVKKIYPLSLSEIRMAKLK